MMKYFEDRQQEEAERERSALARLARPCPERIRRDTGSLSGGGIGAQ